jgi:lipopolysaccharide cholinephosphotransferase
MTETKPMKNPLKRAQKVLTEMLTVIHNICKDNNIDYFLTDGSLLGHVRHGGFIPWDDDIDIGMLRKDYNRFKKIIDSSLPDIYKVETYDLNTHGKHNWVKIMYLGDFEWVDADGERHKGISLDIFPYDYVLGKEKLSVTGQIFNRLSRVFYPKKITNPKDLLHTILNRSKLYNLYCPFMKETDTITYGVETHFYGIAYFDINEIFPLKTGIFEGQEFNIPKNPDHYLKNIYGDYMKIPDESDRQIHMVNLQLSE